MRLRIRLKTRASMKVLRLAALGLAAFGLTAKSAGAQFLQYTPPGGPEVRPESRQDELKRELAEARYHLGPVRIAPWFSLHDIAYVQSVLTTGGEQLPNDLTATFGAGFRAYLHNGPKAIWTAQVLPEYVFWLHQTDRRQLDGRYQLGYNAYFNHLTVEAKAGREQLQQLVTPEVPVPVSSGATAASCCSSWSSPAPSRPSPPPRSSARTTWSRTSPTPPWRTSAGSTATRPWCAPACAGAPTATGRWGSGPSTRR